MANTFFKSFAENDRTSTRTLLHENIPITGTIVSGTYTNADKTAQKNIKSFSHGMFKSVYDYPYASSSANHIFDVSYGILTSASFIHYGGTKLGHATNKDGNAALDLFDYDIRNIVTGSEFGQMLDKKSNLYSQMAQILMGFNTDGDVRLFDLDGNLSAGRKIGSAFFINLSRLIVKDEIKKGTFSLTMGSANSYDAPFASTFTLADLEAGNKYFTNSPAGEFGILYTGSSADGTTFGDSRGLIFSQAGVAVIPAASNVAGGDMVNAVWQSNGQTKVQTLVTASMDTVADSFLHRLDKVQFNNTTELNSTIYFCRANHNEFNYSSNPTYLSQSKIVVKGDNVLAPPRSYVTTVGLYSADNELLAVAKLSEPLRKDPTNELTLRVRLDY